MARRNGNNMPRRADVAEATSLAPCMSDSTPQIYGGHMIQVGGQWTKINGVDGMKYLEATGGVNLEVNGSIPMNQLDPGKSYKGVFEVSLADGASGFNTTNLVTVEVCIPRGSPLTEKYNVMNDTTLTTPTFRTPRTLSGNLTFKLHQKTANVDKKGLVVECFSIEAA